MLLKPKHTRQDMRVLHNCGKCAAYIILPPDAHVEVAVLRKRNPSTFLRKNEVCIEFTTSSNLATSATNFESDEDNQLSHDEPQMTDQATPCPVLQRPAHAPSGCTFASDAVEFGSRRECGNGKLVGAATASLFRQMKFCPDILTVGTLGKVVLMLLRGLFKLILQRLS